MAGRAWRVGRLAYSYRLEASLPQRDPQYQRPVLDHHLGVGDERVVHEVQLGRRHEPSPGVAFERWDPSFLHGCGTLTEPLLKRCDIELGHVSSAPAGTQGRRGGGVATLEGVLDRRLLIVTGKGGTGRSALAASLAIRAAREGRRVLAVAMADPHGLAGHLRTGGLGALPVEPHPGLSVVAIEPAAALDEYLRLRLKVPRLGVMTRAFRVLADTVPGIRDTVVIGKLLWEATRPEWDLVVADAPPTGQIMSFLRAPSTIEGLVPASRVQDQAAWMRRMLSDSEVAAVVVAATPEDLPVTEALETIAALTEERLVAVAAVVANRVLPDLLLDRARLDREPPGPRHDAALLHLEVATRQRDRLGELGADQSFPLLFGIRTPGEVASRLADYWSLS